MSNYAYKEGKKGILGGTNGPIDWDTDTIKCALVNQTYRDIADKSAHNAWDDVSSNEITGTNYTAGGATLTITIADDGASGYKLTATNPTWANSTIANAWGCVVYKSTGTASTSCLLGFYDFGSAVSSTADTFTISGFSTGFYTLP